MKKYILVSFLLFFPSFFSTAHAQTGPATITKQIAASLDDVNQDGSPLTTNATTIWLGTGSSTTNSFTGLRFTNVSIPQGATINEARLDVYSSQQQWNSISMQIAADAANNSAPFSSANKPSQRALTTAKINHSSNVQWQTNTWYSLNEMASVIQEVVNRPGWNSGNALSVITKGTGGSWGRKFVRSFDGSAVNAIKLIITYTANGSPANTPTLTFTPTPTSSPTPTPIPTNTPTSTLTPTPTNESTPTPIPTGPTPTSPPQIVGEWSQHGHDAQRTSYTDQVVTTPWHWKWAWNGPNATGGISSGKASLPKNVQPVTGGGRVYVAGGNRGVYALSEQTGSVMWNATLAGNINSTVAYDPQTQSVFAVSSNGTLYKLDSTSGAITGQYITPGTSTLPLPPLILTDRVIFSMGQNVYALDKTNLSLLWSYDAISAVHTPVAYSPSRNLVIVVTQDLFVHAIRNTDGTQNWRTKPTPRNGGDPGGTSTTLAEALNGWPVIAEVHGYVLVKYRIEWNALWTWNPWPVTNTQMRSNLQSRPDQQALFVLNLDNGVVPFTTNIGHGGYGDGNYLPMGSQPVVKRFQDNTEVVYMMIRGTIGYGYDGRWDSHLGEILLDNTTVPGYSAGDVRFIYYIDPEKYFLTDEQPNVTMAGDYLFAGHWEAGQGVRILDRSDTKGSWTNRITSAVIPHVVTSQDNTIQCSFSSNHYCPNGLTNTRSYPAGFYIYYNQGAVYDQYWNEYSTWTVSNNTAYFRSTDGAIIALENGDPLAQNLMDDATVTLARVFDWFSSLSTALLEITPNAKKTYAARNIQSSKAEEYVGKIHTVKGIVKDIINNGKEYLLAFSIPHQGTFKIMIAKASWGNFKNSIKAAYAPGTLLQVVGRMQWYQGDPIIYVNDPSQITVLK